MFRPDDKMFAGIPMPNVWQPDFSLAEYDARWDTIRSCYGQGGPGWDANPQNGGLQSESREQFRDFLKQLPDTAPLDTPGYAALTRPFWHAAN